jgi:hypothetical protein
MFLEELGIIVFDNPARLNDELMTHNFRWVPIVTECGAEFDFSKLVNGVKYF